MFLYPPAWISEHHQKITEAENLQLQNFPPIKNVLARIQATQLFKVNEQHRQALENVALHFIANTDDFLVPVHKSTDLMKNLDAMSIFAVQVVGNQYIWLKTAVKLYNKSKRLVIVI